MLSSPSERYDGRFRWFRSWRARILVCVLIDLQFDWLRGYCRPMMQRSVDCSPHVSRNVFWCYRNLIGRWKARRHSFIYRSSFPFNLLWVNSIVGWAVNNPYSSSWKNISGNIDGICRGLVWLCVCVCVCVCVCLCRSLGTKTRVIGMVYFEFWNMIPCWT